MATYFTSKYGTKINIDGLTPEQVAKVKATAESNGAYGAKAAALAAELQKRNTAPTTTGTVPTAPTASSSFSSGASVNLGVGEAGTINQKQATTALTGAERQDAIDTINLSNPALQSDALGNSKSTTIDPATGKVVTSETAGSLNTAAQGFLSGALGSPDTKLDLTPELTRLNSQRLDISGAPKILETGDVRADAQKVADANYGYLTRNLERDKRREMEEAKQELAQRGIPIDPGNPDSLWNKTVGSINQRYSDLDAQASQQALMSRDSSMGALAGVQSTARNSFLQGAGLEFDANTGLAKDSAALKGMVTGNALNQIGTGLSAVGATSGTFNPFQGTSVDNSGVLAGLLSKMSDQELSRYGIDKDYAAKLKAIAKPTGGGGGGSDTGFGVIIGGVAP